MRNELLERRYVNKVTKLGVSNYMAKEIVKTAFDNGYDNVEFAIKYAIDITYGLGRSKRENI